MCGFAGLVLSPPRCLTKDFGHRVLNLLRHRGPDAQGVLFFDGNSVRLAQDAQDVPSVQVALFHRRLSIVDLSEAGWQPMGTSSEDYFIVFNGEVYNFIELRNELASLGYTFRSHSDTEALLAAYAHWGLQSLQRLVGMFAFAILDVRNRKVILARDFFGIKPLYYCRWTGGFAFASEIKPLLELPGVSRKVSAPSLYDYLRFGLTDHVSATLFEDIKQVPPAHYLEVLLDGPSQSDPIRYWDVDFTLRADLSLDEAAERLRDLFLESIRLHLRSDVPVGSALSGGIDSSAIVMGVRHFHPAAEIHAFSYIPDTRVLSEERWVDAVGKAARAVVHKVRPRAAELATDLEALIRTQEEPFGSSSVYAQYRVFGLAREAGIKVMLDGQGADELLGGYRYYLPAQLASLIRRRQWAEVRRLFLSASRLPNSTWVWLVSRAFGSLLPDDLQRILRGVVEQYHGPRWLNGTWFRSQGVRPKPFLGAISSDGLKASLYHSLTETSLPHLLRYEDRNSMAFSIESRVPFLTPAMASFVLSLPEEYIIAPDGTSKAVFRRAMRGIVPDAVLDRKDKVGFATPEHDWLVKMNSWVTQCLRSETARRIPALRASELEKDWVGVVEGLRPFDWRVWRWINVIRWTELYDPKFE